VTDAWEPQTYELFKRERSEPFSELLKLAQPAEIGRGVDLGCGTGELTALAKDRLAVAELLGIDSSPAMLREAEAHAGAGLRFERGDLATWTARRDHDLVLSNAALQWAPDHRAVLARWTDALAPGGQLLVQVPANADHPANRLAGEVAREAPFLEALGGDVPEDPVARNVLAPRDYAQALHELGYERQHVRLQVFGHELPSSAHVTDWLAGTTLNRFKAGLSAELFERLVARHRERVVQVLGEKRPYFFGFARVLLWASLPR
jgi:trans-aconitate 2-methyltransferase